MNLETKITIYKFTPQVFTLTRCFILLIHYAGSRRPIQRMSGMKTPLSFYAYH